MPREDSDGVLLLDVVHVHLGVFAARSDEVLRPVDAVAAPERAVYGEVALRDPDVLSDEGAGLDVPEVESLAVHVEDGVAVARVDGERHYSLVFTKNLEKKRIKLFVLVLLLLLILEKSLQCCNENEFDEYSPKHR